MCKDINQLCRDKYTRVNTFTDLWMILGGPALVSQDKESSSGFRLEDVQIEKEPFLLYSVMRAGYERDINSTLMLHHASSDLGSLLLLCKASFMIP